MALILVAVTMGLAGCTPEGLMVFGHSARLADVPTDAARSVLPTVADDDFRLLGTVASDTYYAAILVGSDHPWCLLQVGPDGTASATCAADPEVVTYSPGRIVSLSNDPPDELHVWDEVETSFWVTPLK